MTKPEFRRIILVGLGGSGRTILTSLKRLFMDTYNVMPPSVRMLSIDTDAAPVSLPSHVGSRTYTLGPEEMLYLKVDSPASFIDHNPLVTWFVKPIPTGAISAGAGAVRQVGRLALFSRLHEFQERVGAMKDALFVQTLPDAMENARRQLGSTTDFRLSDRDIEIFVCGSLAGGTGSGTFLDVGILMRREFPNAAIHGFFLLDWIFRNKAFAYRTGPNVYAALCELDNVQSLVYGQANVTPYRVSYGRFQDIDVTNPPYTLCHLVDGRNEDGENVADADDLATVVARAIFLSVSSMGHGVASVVDNLKGHIYSHGTREWGGKFARYSSLGVSSLCYPAREYWRVQSLEQALRLCRLAREEVAEGHQAGGVPPEEVDRIDSDVQSLIIGMNPDDLRQRVTSRAGDAAFEPADASELGDREFPNALKSRLNATVQAREAALDAAFDAAGQNKVAECVERLRNRQAELEANRSLTRAYRDRWAEVAAARFKSAIEEIEKDVATHTKDIEARRRDTDAELAAAASARYVSLLNVGERRTKVDRWCQGTARTLVDLASRRRLGEFDRRLYDELLAAVESGRPPVVERPHEVVDALATAERQLERDLRHARMTIEAMRHESSTAVIGSGHVWFTRRLLDTLVEQGDAVHRPADRANPPDHPISQPVEDRVVIELDYDAFKRKGDIRTGDDYLRLHQRGGDALSRLFAGYCEERLGDMTAFTVWDAMEQQAREEGVSPDDYIASQFRRLFRLASPLWRYDRSLVHALRRPYYDKIINIGVGDAERSRDRFETIVSDVKAKFDIGVDHAWTTTGDPSRVWLLAYAAALPAYFLTDLERKKLEYEEAITPTFHTDSYLEMNCPDIFPEGDFDNISLRLLGVAIVPDIDVVLDEKLLKGHRFTCDAPEIRKLTGNEPLQWLLFRDMLQAVRKNKELREVVDGLLRRRVGSMSPHDGALLERGDLRDPAALILRLQASARQADDLDRLHRRVHDGLSDTVRAAIAAYRDGDPVPDDLEAGLVSDLNRLLGGPCIHDAALFRAVRLPDRVEQALAQHQRQRAQGSALVALNRLLLRAAFVEPGQARYPEVSLIRRSVKSAIEAHIAHLRKKLDSRDFSRVVSARLTYREIKGLEQFLEPRPRGYGMQVGDYLAGTL